jgi:hypothetical protein
MKLLSPETIRRPLGVLGRAARRAAFAGALLFASASAAAEPPAPAAVEPPAPPAAEQTDEVVETIQDEAPPRALPPAEATSPPAAPPPPESPDQFAVSGWAREELDLTTGEAPVQPPYLAVPHDRFISRTMGFVRFRYARRQAFELNASSSLRYGYFVNDSGGGAPDRFEARGSFEPVIHELYAGFFSRKTDLRIGQQRVAWGRADVQSPNDVLNARDLRDPFSTESEVTNIPTPLVRLDADLGRATLEGVWAPVFVPDRFDLYGSNWALVQPNSPLAIRGLMRSLSSLVDRSLLDQFNRLVQQSRLPSASLGNMSAGAKLATTLASVDLDAYYYFGFDRTPLLAIDPGFAATLNQIDFSRATAADFGPFFSAIQAGASPMTFEYVRTHHVGLDAGTVIGPVGLRIDAGYDTNHVLYRRDLSGVQTRASQTTLSLEYQTGDVRKVFLVEGSVLFFPDAPSGALLFVDRTTLNAAALVRYPIFMRFDAEVRVIATREPASIAVRPQLAWKVTDAFSLAAGGLWLAGDAAGIGGYFKQNSDVHLIAKYSL